MFKHHFKHTNKKNVKEKKMAGSGNIFELRKWMYIHRDANGRVTKEYLAGLKTFMHQADSTQLDQ